MVPETIVLVPSAPPECRRPFINADGAVENAAASGTTTADFIIGCSFACNGSDIEGCHATSGSAGDGGQGAGADGNVDAVATASDAEVRNDESASCARCADERRAI